MKGSGASMFSGNLAESLELFQCAAGGVASVHVISNIRGVGNVWVSYGI
jgi:hypothetical protein